MNPSDNFDRKFSKVWTRNVKQHYDERGYFLEYFRQSIIGDFELDFVQDSVSFSKRNVLRGLHIQENQWQLSTLLQGAVQYFVLDIDPNSDDYLKLETIFLSAEGITQVLAAPGIAHGFFATSSEVVMSYKNSTYYENTLQHGINFASFDSMRNIVSDCVRSKRDTNFLGISEMLGNSSFKEYQSRISPRNP